MARDQPPEALPLAQPPEGSPAEAPRASRPPHSPQQAAFAAAVVREALSKDPAEDQFSLRDLFLLVTAAGVLFLPLSWMPRPVFAGLAGGLTVLLMFIQTFFQPRHLLMRWSWWLLLALYLTAAAMAVAGV